MSVEKFLKQNKHKNKNTLEKNIESAFCKYAELKGCKALKLTLNNLRHFPDRTILCPSGKVIFIEFKRKGLKATPGQLKCRSDLEALGFSYFICDSYNDATNILDDFLFSD